MSSHEGLAEPLFFHITPPWASYWSVPPRNEDLRDVVHPGVTMVTHNIAMLSTDAERGFGIVVSNIDSYELSISGLYAFLPSSKYCGI